MARLNNIPYSKRSAREDIHQATLKTIDLGLDLIAQKFGLLGEIVAKSIGVVVKTLDEGRMTWKDYETVTLHISKNIGLSREQSQSLQSSLMESVKSLGAIYGTNYKELAKLQESYSTNISRAIMLSREQLENQVAITKLVGEQTWNAASESFAKLGASSDVAAAHLAVAQERARKLGLSASKSSEIFAKNISVASKYHFKEGVNGLSKMVMQSQRLRINMETMTSAADKFMSIEDAITTSANLQVLGGSVGQAFSNPMEVMALANIDMNGFMDKIESAFSDKGTWDDKNGVVKFDPVTMRMMREVSKQLGVSVDELNNIASSKVVSQKIDVELGASKGQFTEDELSAIYNLAGNNYDKTTGKHYIQANIDGQDVIKYVDNLTPETLKELLPYADKETEMAANVHDIAGNVARIAGTYKERASDYTSLNEREQGISEVTASTVASWTDGVMKFFSDSSKWVGELVSEHPNIAALGSTIGKIAGFMFEEGGVVGGNSYHGDKVLARVNSGEMVLNKEQQSNLVNAIKTNPNVKQYSDGGSIGLGAQQMLFNVANSRIGIGDDDFISNGNQSTSSKIGGAATTTILYKYGGIGGKTTNVLNKIGVATVESTSEMVKVIGELTREMKDLTKLVLRPITKPILAISNYIRPITNYLQPLSKGLKSINVFRPITETIKNIYFGKTGMLGKTQRFWRIMSSGKLGDALNFAIKNSKFGVTARKLKVAKSGKYGQFLARRYGTVVDGGELVNYGGKSLFRNMQLASQDLAIRGDIMAARSASKSGRVSRVTSKYFGKILAKTGEFSSDVMELLTKMSVSFNRLKGMVYSFTVNVIDKIKIPRISIGFPRIGERFGNAVTRTTNGVSRLGARVLGEGGKKALIKVGGKVLSVGAKALRASTPWGLASLGVEAGNWGAKKLGLYEEGGHADKIAKIGAKTLEYASYGAMLGSIIPIPVISQTVGATVGAAVGATIGTFEQYNKEIGDGLASLLGQKESVEQKRANNVAKIEQYEFERDKLGITNINDPQLQEKSYLATIGIHDLLISKFNKDDGLGEEGKSKEVLAEEKMKAKEGHWYDAITTFFGFSKGGEVKEPNHPLPVNDGDTVLARLTPGEVVLNQEQQVKVVETLKNLGISKASGIQSVTPQVEALPNVGEQVKIRKTPSIYDGYNGGNLNSTNHTTSEHHKSAQETITHKPIDININGTLKLVGGNNTTANIDVKQLCDNPEFKKIIYNYITSEMDRKGQLGVGQKTNSSAAQRGYGFDSSTYF